MKYDKTRKPQPIRCRRALLSVPALAFYRSRRRPGSGWHTI